MNITKTDKWRLDWCANRLNSIHVSIHYLKIEWTDVYGVWRYTETRHENNIEKALRSVIDDAINEENQPW